MAKVTILLETKTRDELKAVGRKDQTYDQLILEHPWCQVQHKHQSRICMCKYGIPTVILRTW